MLLDIESNRKPFEVRDQFPSIGPGTYSIESKQKKQLKISNSKRKIQLRTFNDTAFVGPDNEVKVGPASYKPHYIQTESTATYSTLPRYRYKRDCWSLAIGGHLTGDYNEPAPGQYGSIEYKSKSPKIKVNSTPRNLLFTSNAEYFQYKMRMLKNGVPGAGEYRPENCKVSKSCPRISIYNSDRYVQNSQVQIEAVPGPGAYKISNVDRHGRKFTYGGSFPKAGVKVRDVDIEQKIFVDLE
ncbi:Conserved_hypothetical protein [Hexamita inflata]|uniref:Uncharacterized protein n=1 Tax=Hexamita inflata TaxID=28002 RepID=A0AA86UF51_9EUKA|nr:Conserved hypothetical protein [Hexamita inflata]CAI9948687.1 Conserved hypothetical protein [Hexamita inflata]